MTKKNHSTLSLVEELNGIEQEARMILPGIQTLFGFQLIVGLNPSFKQSVTLVEQYLHLTSILLVTISGVLVVAPAAYHRQVRGGFSKRLLETSSRFLTIALVPLALGTSLDLYLVTRIMGESRIAALIISSLVFLLYIGVWFVYPRLKSNSMAELLEVEVPHE